MKCPKCGTEMVWMGDVTILMRNCDKHYCHLTKKAFASKDIELWGASFDRDALMCPNYLNCGNLSHIATESNYAPDEEPVEIKIRIPKWAFNTITKKSALPSSFLTKKTLFEVIVDAIRGGKIEKKG